MSGGNRRSTAHIIDDLRKWNGRQYVEAAERLTELEDEVAKLTAECEEWHYQCVVKQERIMTLESQTFDEDASP